MRPGDRMRPGGQGSVVLTKQHDSLKEDSGDLGNLGDLGDLGVPCSPFLNRDCYFDL